MSMTPNNVKSYIRLNQIFPLTPSRSSAIDLLPYYPLYIRKQRAMVALQETCAMTKPLTVQQFFALFPDDDTCLDHLFRTRFGEQVLCGKCHRISKFYRIAAELAYSCRGAAITSIRWSARRSRRPIRPAALVLRHVPVHHDPARGFRQGTAAPVRLLLQNRLAHGPRDPQVHGRARRRRPAGRQRGGRRDLHRRQEEGQARHGRQPRKDRRVRHVRPRERRGRLQGGPGRARPHAASTSASTSPRARRSTPTNGAAT